MDKDKTRPILYGVADYARIRHENAWFVDRTAKIRDLEATSYAMFLRPRRFGKSLLTSILETYYDIPRPLNNSTSIPQTMTSSSNGD